MVAPGSGRSPVLMLLNFRLRFAGEVRDFPEEEYFDKKEGRKMDLFIQYALGAAVMALADSGLEINDENAERVGVVVGSGMGGLPAIERYHEALMQWRLSQNQPVFHPHVDYQSGCRPDFHKVGGQGP